MPARPRSRDDARRAAGGPGARGLRGAGERAGTARIARGEAAGEVASERITLDGATGEHEATSRGAAADGTGETYGEAAPPRALADRVACLWWVRSATRGAGAADDHDAPARSILPDGCVDLVWHAGRLTVAGPDTTARPAEPGDGTTVGVRLRPGAATTFGTTAAALRDQHPAAEELWGAEGRRLAERVAEQCDVRDRLAVLAAAVAARARDAEPTDPAVDAVARALRDGRTGVADLARDAALSERQLRRRFHEHVGYGPKTLERVLRLQRFLGLAIATDEDLVGLAALAGFADQGHLGREARALTGATPAELVALRRPGRSPADDARPLRTGGASGGRPSASVAVRRGAAATVPADVSETSKTGGDRGGRMAA